MVLDDKNKNRVQGVTHHMRFANKPLLPQIFKLPSIVKPLLLIWASNQQGDLICMVVYYLV